MAPPLYHTTHPTTHHPSSQVAEEVGGKRPVLLIAPRICGVPQYTTSYSALLINQEVWRYSVFYLLL